VLLVDGRGELVGDLAGTEPARRTFLAEEVRALLDQPRFIDAIFGYLRPDMASQARAETVVLSRLREISRAR